MKATFKGKEIFSAKQPSPKKNQVWKNNESNELQKVLSTTKQNHEIVSALFEDEEENRFELGVGWLNGREYTYIGYLF